MVVVVAVVEGKYGVKEGNTIISSLVKTTHDSRMGNHSGRDEGVKMAFKKVLVGG